METHRKALTKKATVKKFAQEMANSRRSSHGNGKASFIRKEELAPDSIEFPLSHWGECLKGARNEDYLFTVRLGWDSAVTCDGSGVYSTVTSDSPVQAQNWSGYAAVFDAYRVLAFKVEYDPFWTVNISFAPIASVLDRSDATALTGYGLAERFSSHKKVPGQKRFHQLINMSGDDESQFVITSSPTAKHWFKPYTSGNTASMTLGRLNVTLLVQFRGVGIN